MYIWAMFLSGAVACVFAILMVLQRSLYSAALCLLGVIGSSAALFLLSGAPLVAFLQVMIYAGAVMVLIVVTIMASRPSPARFAETAVPKPIAVLAAIGIFAELLALAGKSPNDYVGFLGITRNPLGPVLFTSYGPATEAVTLLLFISALAVLDSRPSK